MDIGSATVLAPIHSTQLVNLYDANIVQHEFKCSFAYLMDIQDFFGLCEVDEDAQHCSKETVAHQQWKL